MLKAATGSNLPLIGGPADQTEGRLFGLLILVSAWTTPGTVLIVDQANLIASAGQINLATSDQMYFDRDSLAQCAMWRIGWEVLDPKRIANSSFRPDLRAGDRSCTPARRRQHGTVPELLGPRRPALGHDGRDAGFKRSSVDLGPGGGPFPWHGPGPTGRARCVHRSSNDPAFRRSRASCGVGVCLALGTRSFSKGSRDLKHPNRGVIFTLSRSIAERRRDVISASQVAAVLICQSVHSEHCC